MAPEDTMEFVVAGAHMDGGPLNWQLTSVGAKKLRVDYTAPVYRAYKLGEIKPGLVLQNTAISGKKIAVEVWEMPKKAVGHFLLTGVKAPLALGKVRMQNGKLIDGFVCEGGGVNGSPDITIFGGWRGFETARTEKRQKLTEHDFRLETLQEVYGNGTLTPSEVAAEALRRIKEHGNRDNAFILTLPGSVVEARCKLLEAEGMTNKPLYGIPFVVKDVMDYAGVPTTCGCPEFAFTPSKTATCIRALEDAGAILLGKMNLDQFSTGLVGVRSPYGAVQNSFNPEYISGGSSAGSAVAVANGLCTFSLGTDTAGSGRVPAALNNIVGMKPTRGTVSTVGVFPACKTLDCVAIFGFTCKEVNTVFRAMNVTAALDDPFARPSPWSPVTPAPTSSFTFATPRETDLEFFGNAAGAVIFRNAVKTLEALGGKRVDIDYGPFKEVAEMLYQGPWVAERLHAVGELLESNPGALLPVLRKIVNRGRKFSAKDTFHFQYKLAELRRKVDANMEGVDLLVTPTAGTTYKISEVQADPLQLNSNMGYYTNFMNLVDRAAIAVPAGFLADTGLPFGVTLSAVACTDDWLAEIGQRFQEQTGLAIGAPASKATMCKL